MRTGTLEPPRRVAPAQRETYLRQGHSKHVQMPGGVTVDPSWRSSRPGCLHMLPSVSCSCGSPISVTFCSCMCLSWASAGSSNTVETYLHRGTAEMRTVLQTRCKFECRRVHLPVRTAPAHKNPDVTARSHPHAAAAMHSKRDSPLCRCTETLLAHGAADTLTNQQARLTQN